VEIDVEGRVGAAPQAFDIKLRVKSFVRDVVSVR
jgi:hypothetical protein